MLPLIGQSELDLVAALGVPVRTYEVDGRKFLTFEERRSYIVAGDPFLYRGYEPLRPLLLAAGLHRPRLRDHLRSPQRAHRELHRARRRLLVGAGRQPGRQARTPGMRRISPPRYRSVLGAAALLWAGAARARCRCAAHAQFRAAQHRGPGEAPAAGGAAGPPEQAGAGAHSGRPDPEPAAQRRVVRRHQPRRPARGARRGGARRRHRSAQRARPDAGGRGRGSGPDGDHVLSPLGARRPADRRAAAGSRAAPGVRGGAPAGSGAAADAEERPVRRRWKRRRPFRARGSGPGTAARPIRQSAFSASMREGRPGRYRPRGPRPGAAEAGAQRGRRRGGAEGPAAAATFPSRSGARECLAGSEVATLESCDMPQVVRSFPPSPPPRVPAGVWQHCADPRRLAGIERTPW